MLFIITFTFTGIKYKLLDTTKGLRKVKQENSTSFSFEFPCESTTSCTPYEIYFSPGYYSIELWGASGGNAREQNTDEMRADSGGHGAFVSGQLLLSGTYKFYLYIGGKGEDQSSIEEDVMSLGGFNGGGNGGVNYNESYPESGAGGGGATDLRFIAGSDNFSYMSRIIVAAGGGGGISTNNNNFIFKNRIPGHGGKLAGTSNASFVFPGTQKDGIFGRGQDGLSFPRGGSIFPMGGSTAGGGAGYYGATSEKCSPTKNGPNLCESAGGGGSSFISGYEGCLAVEYNKNGIIDHKTDSIHYSRLKFDNPIMKDYSDESFLSPLNVYEEGHIGNGYARINIIMAKPSIEIFLSCKYNSIYLIREISIFTSIFIQCSF